VRFTSSQANTEVRAKQIVSLRNKSHLNARTHLEELRERIAPLREALLHHPIYTEVDSMHRLRQFMQMHVFAVLGTSCRW
jgi:hypothetical protein